MNFRKIIQKQIYNILSQKYYVVCFIFFVLTTLLSLVHLCEVWLYRSWSMKDQLWFNSFMDNIGNHRLHGNLSQYLPIDVVYTWVNGSDPLFRSQLADHRRSLIMTSSAECPFANCLPSNYLAGRLGSGVESLKGYSDFEIVNSKMSADKWKLVTLDSPESATNRLAYVEGDVYQAHWTTDGSLLNIYSSNDTIMFQVPCDNMKKISRYALRSWLRVSVKTFWIYENVCKVVVQLNIAALLVLKGKQWSIVHADGMNLNVTAAHLLLELPTKMKSSDYVASRYDDKEELRYSLRSLEMYAPWVRKVFLVTNGQIPNWLELDNPKLSLITHEMIFPNRSHLPTFSSPAIETHLHRIPGLSEKFLYMNDDILFGDHVLPEDFISQREGQKIYLSWPIPDCSNSCPWSWVKDGACDLPCNVSTCAYDGGDCLEEEGDQSQLADLYGDEQGMNHDYDADQQAAETRKRRSAESNKSKEELLRIEENTEKQNAESNRKKMEEELRTEENREKQNAESNREKMKEELRTEENREKQIVEINREKMKEELRTEENREKQNVESNRENMKEELRKEENREKQNVETNREKMKEELRTEANREKQNVESNREKMKEELRTEENREKQNVEINREKMKEGTTTIGKSLYPFTNSTSKIKQLLNDIFSDQKLEETTKRQSVESNKTKEELITEESRVKRNADSHTKKMKEELKTTVDKSFHFFLDCASKTRRLYNDIFPYRHKKCRCGYFRRVINSSVNITLVTAQCRYLWNDLLSRRTLKMRAFRPEGSGDVHHRFRRDVSNGTVSKMFENVGLSRRDNVEKDRNSYNNQIKNAAKARAKELGKQFLYNNTERPRKLDTYAESLLHVNTLLNNRYGFKRRKVPAHMPHLIDRTIITELQKTFPEEFKKTSSRKIRSPNDMQFAFSYFYFLMGEEIQMTVEQIFDIFDTDKTGTWSDREIRTILTRLFPLPLQRSSIVGFEQLLLNCAQKWPTAPDTTTPMYERYLGSVLPLIKKSMVAECKEMSNVLRKKFGSKKRFPHVIMQHQDTVGFYMVGSNLSDLILSLDSIRSKPKKFICLNDNMDTSRSDDNEIVTAALIDFYHSLFPQPSQFELPAEFVNRFLYYDDYLVWKQHHDFVSNCITIFVILVGSFGFVIFKNELRWLLKKLIKIWRGEKIISRKRSNTRTTQNDVILNIT